MIAISKQSTPRLITGMFIVLLSIGAAAQAKPEALAQQSADSWLALVDSGKYADSWDESAQAFKAAVTKDQWQNALKATREPLGKLLSRKVKSATYTKTLPGAPDGELRRDPIRDQLRAESGGNRDRDSDAG